MTVYTVIFDWADSSISAGDSPVLMVVEAATADEAMVEAERKYLYFHPDVSGDDLYHVITFHSDVTNLQA